MEDILNLLLGSGLPVVVTALLIVIGFMCYYIFVKGSKESQYVDATIKGLTAQMDEQHTEMEKFSKVIFELRKELEKEKERSFQLREEIYALRCENLRLTSMVADLENLVKTLREENKRLNETLRAYNSKGE